MALLSERKLMLLMKIQIHFTEQEISVLAREHYGVEAEALTLRGYDELNYLLEDKAGKRYICKVAFAEHGYDFLDAQVKVLEHLSRGALSGKFPCPLSNREGRALTTLRHDNQVYYLRILTFLAGTFWAELKEKNEALLLDLGRFLGQMDQVLKDFQHPATHRTYAWDLKNALDARRRLVFIRSHEHRRIAAYFLLQFETEVWPRLSSLRTAVIHNDANDYNVLVKDQAVSGLIDFGDMVHSQLIHNLAIACTYAALGENDPVRVVTRVVKGYHERNPINEEEVELLYFLIAARLCVSVTQSAYNASRQSANEHHFITEKPAWDLLGKWIKINPLAARDAFRQACGFASILPKEEDYGALVKQRKQYIGRNLSLSYQKPLKIVKGALQYLYDDRGRTYLDCVNNVSHVGHCHPTVVKAMQKQIAVLNTNTRYLHDYILDYAKTLCATLPPNLSVCYFTNSGSEANDLAVRMSRNFTGQKDVIVLDHAYHGTSTVALELSPYKFDGKGGSGKPPHVHKALSPDLYRGAYRYNDPQAGRKYAADVQQIIARLTQEGKKPAAFICETLLGVGGQIPLPDHYLKEVYRYVRAAGGVCIADEVQVGFGRVGEKFWGFELQEAIPDMVVLGKPIGNGHPLAAVITTPEIVEVFNNGMEYFNTFGGNPVSMATGLAVMQTIKEEALQQNALEVGKHLLEGLRRLMVHHPIIGDVRGRGLFVGAELVRDRRTLEPAVPEIDIIVEKMKERGFLLSTDGPWHNVLKIKPPIIFSKENAEDLVRNLDEVLAEL
jgi:4-aminobutyrate aminotransferase-like enzyme/Ser/Thr protein kinase RdoA (MazF antagonist)